MPPPLFTLGYSHHDADAFIGLLRQHGITAVADTRSRPFSRFRPEFNHESLKAMLRQHGIAHVFLGRELGGRPEDPDLYDPEGWADYERVRASALFQSGIDRLRQGLRDYTIVLLCGEEDPLDCHRGLMITPALKELGLPPFHIRRDGSLESTDAFEARLQEETGIGPMFPEEAYRVMNRKKAFRWKDDPEAS